MMSFTLHNILKEGLLQVDVAGGTQNKQKFMHFVMFE